MQHRRMDDYRHLGKTSKTSLTDESITLSFAFNTDTQTKRFHQATSHWSWYTFVISLLSKMVDLAITIDSTQKATGGAIISEKGPLVLVFIWKRKEQSNPQERGG